MGAADDHRSVVRDSAADEVVEQNRNVGVFTHMFQTPRSVAVLSVALVLVASPAGGQAPSPTPPSALPLIVHITRGTEGPVASAAQMRRMVAEVNEYYRAAAICFSLQEVKELSLSGNLDKTYRERHAFSAFAVPQAVNVFLVSSIYDPESSDSRVRTAARFGFTPDHWLDEAHIEKPGRQPNAYAIVRVGGGADTMAHELGHILGEGHSADPANLMGYGSDPWKFDAQQIRSFRARVRRELASGALRAVKPCGPVDAS